VSRETGLQLDASFLSPLLNIGLTSENFYLVGKMPEDNILLHM